MTINNLPRVLPSGNVIAANVSEADYMEFYAETFHEWVEGWVIKMSPITLKHADIVEYIFILLKAYFTLKPIGMVRIEPFVMRLALEDRVTRREPDLQIILENNPNTLYQTFLDGPADICVEVVSIGSVSVDYQDKLHEYEQGGVKEYWILDPIRQTYRFNRLNDAGLYIPHEPDAQGHYHTPLLPDFKLHIPTLWQDDLPDFYTIADAVKKMVSGG